MGRTLGSGLYRLRNVPFLAYGFSERDIVMTEQREDWPVVTGIAEPGGHSTYRIVLPKETTEDEFLKNWARLGALGCTYERATSRLVAVDVPPQTDIYAAYDALENGENSKAWEFEEGYCGHALRETPQ